LTYTSQDLTFGGIKHSGFRRMNGAESLRTCCNVKSVLDNRFGLCLANKLFSVGDWDFSRISGAVRLVRGQGTRAEQSTLKAIQARFDPDRYLPNRSQHKRTSSPSAVGITAVPVCDSGYFK
jgi:hypothetical protein